MQDVLALIIVALAGGYLGWRAWAFFAARKKSGCASGCGSCPGSDEQTTGTKKPIVTIELLRESGPQARRPL